jgi:hypothetical protein
MASTATTRVYHCGPDAGAAFANPALHSLCDKFRVVNPMPVCWVEDVTKARFAMVFKGIPRFANVFKG